MAVDKVSLSFQRTRLFHRGCRYTRLIPEFRPMILSAWKDVVLTAWEISYLWFIHRSLNKENHDDASPTGLLVSPDTLLGKRRECSVFIQHNISHHPSTLCQGSNGYHHLKKKSLSKLTHCVRRTHSLLQWAIFFFFPVGYF